MIRRNAEKLLKKAETAMKRDLLHISASVKQKKLAPPASRDLVTYIKLLNDIVKDDREKQIEIEKNLSNRSEDELKAAAKALIEE